MQSAVLVRATSYEELVNILGDKSAFTYIALGQQFKYQAFKSTPMKKICILIKNNNSFGWTNTFKVMLLLLYFWILITCSTVAYRNTLLWQLPQRAVTQAERRASPHPPPAASHSDQLLTRHQLGALQQQPLRFASLSPPPCKVEPLPPLSISVQQGCSI